MAKFLIVDTDVLVSLIDELYCRNKSECFVTISSLFTKFSVIWIPAEVQKEFLGHRERRRKRKKILELLHKKFQGFQSCPITVSQKEITIELGLKADEDRGEMDGMIQAKKAMAVRNKQYYFSEVHIFLKDKKAIARASAQSLTVYNFSGFKNEMRERGIIVT